MDYTGWQVPATCNPGQRQYNVINGQKVDVLWTILVGRYQQHVILDKEQYNFINGQKVDVLWTILVSRYQQHVILNKENTML